MQNALAIHLYNLYLRRVYIQLLRDENIIYGLLNKLVVILLSVQNKFWTSDRTVLSAVANKRGNVE